MKDVEDVEDAEDVDVRCPCQCPAAQGGQLWEPEHMLVMYSGLKLKKVFVSS